MTFNIEKFREDLLTKRIIKDKLTLRQAADQIGASAATISRVEHAHVPDMGTFCKICAWICADAKIYFIVPVKKESKKFEK